MEMIVSIDKPDAWAADVEALRTEWPLKKKSFIPDWNMISLIHRENVEEDTGLWGFLMEWNKRGLFLLIARQYFVRSR